VWVSVRPGGEQSRCDLEFRPKLQGAVMLLEQGQIRAMVGGNDNRNFNRALDAKRQLGSTWKPLLYLAALQLGWTPVDALDNRPNVFHFEGTWYYPRADHKSEPWSSMSWAGTRSENLASIYLLAHITDRLNPAQLKEVAAMVDLVERNGEGRAEFVRRIRDEHGVISTAAWLPALAFGAARLELIGHLGVDTPAGRELMSMSYGRGLDKERARVDAAGGRRHAGKTTALNRTYRHLARVGTRCLQQLGSLRAYSEAVADSRASSGWGWPLRRAASPPPAPSVDSFGDLVSRVQAGEASIGCGDMGPEWTPIDAPFLDWVGLGGVADWDDAAVSVNRGIPLSLLAELHGMMKRRLLVWEGADPYEMDLLQYHPDYRVLVGMSYVSHLAQAMGVRESLPPVLSMPLGAVDISLASAATMYQGMMDAQMWTFPGWRASPSDGGPRAAVASPKQAVQLISEIRDRAGRVLYRADPMPRPIADASAGRLTGDILRNVVRWGTGRRAAGARVSGQPIPLAGKTGTTNGYRNAAFAGFVPRANAGEWRWGQGYTLAVYVGYDDNRSMVRAGGSLQGSNGALPVWLSTVEGMAEAGLLGEPDSSVDLEWLDEPEYQRVSVVAGSGLIDPAPDDSVALARTVLVLGNPWQAGATRQFAPVGAGARPLTAVSTAPLERDAALPVDGLDDQPSDL
jgi:penicillin-binding protein 1A